jgi:hypothetical protein
MWHFWGGSKQLDYQKIEEKLCSAVINRT